MKFLAFSAVAAVCVASPSLAAAQPAPSPAASSASGAPSAATPAPGPSPTAAVTTSAKDALKRLQTGSVDRSQWDAKMNAALTDDQLKQVASQFSALGDIATFDFADSQVIQGITLYRYRVTFTSGTQHFMWLYSVDADGKIAGLYLRPAQ